MKTLHTDGTLDEICARVRALAPNTQRLWGKMSAHEMLCHLNDSFGLGLGEKQASDISTAFTRTVMRWGALKVPMKWPQGIPTLPEMDPQDRGTKPVEFERDRAALEANIRRFAAQPRGYTFGRHPIFREMSEWEWMRWGYLHADHHLRQFGK